MIRSSALLALLLLVSSLAVADVRAPTGKWVVDFDDARCLAGRNYGTVEKPMLLVLKQPIHGSVMQLQWIEKGGMAEPLQTQGTIRFDQQPPLDISMLLYHTGKTGRRVYEMNVPIERLSAAADATRLRLQGRWLDEELELSSVAPLLKTMGRCVSDLRTHWNASESGDDDASVPALKSHAKGNLVQYFQSEDYPRLALMKNQEGKVGFSLLIDEKGRVADCSVIEPSGVAALDAQSCAILTERARFTPAIGAGGKPARDSYIGRVQWRTE